ncbi:hypothetical protein HOY80DRAFT_1038328 [Tuber brumale]|nr:hypothetical protein HOY80DRAFT_1038328 [Tuber brumale]
MAPGGSAANGAWLATLLDTVIALVDNWVRRRLDQRAKKDKAKNDIEIGITANAAAPTVTFTSVRISDGTDGSAWEDARDGRAKQVSQDEEPTRFLQETADDGQEL